MSQSSYHADLTPEQLTEAFRLIGEIDEFKGQWKKLREIPVERLAELRQVSFVHSVASAMALDGTELSDVEVGRILSGMPLDSGRTPGAQGARGYADLLRLVLDRHRELPLDEASLRNLHRILLQHEERESRRGGVFAEEEQGDEASPGVPAPATAATLRSGAASVPPVALRASAPADTKRVLADLILETNSALLAAQVHPLVVIARFVLRFLALHPFGTANGRLSHAIAALLLMQAGYDHIPYSSFERVIEEDRVPWNAALRASQLSRWDDPRPFGAWLLYFLRVVRAQQKSVLSRLDLERHMLQLSAVQEQIMALVEQHGRVKSAFLARSLGLPARTVRYHLDMLIRNGLLEPSGAKRGRTYHRSTKAAAVSPEADPVVGAILAHILDAGGRIKPAALRELAEGIVGGVSVLGSMHGNRLALLRRDPRSGDSVLTARGRALAEQYVFAQRRSAWAQLRTTS